MLVKGQAISAVQLVYSFYGIIKAGKGEYSKENLGNTLFM